MQIISLKKKSIFLTLVILTILILTSITSGINIENISKFKEETNDICSFEQNNGTLSGYVTDQFGLPIDDALVRVYFHETYEEDYSDETGYYHVTEIPICYCMKNVSCSKAGYITEVVQLSIAKNTTYDFTLYLDDVYPVFDGSQCNGWWNSPVTVSFVYDPEIVAEIWYNYNGWHLYTEPFVVDENGFITIDCYWIDFEGVQSPIASFILAIDQQPPNTDITWETYKEFGKWYVSFTFFAEDTISGLTYYLDIYIDDVLQTTVIFVAPEYTIGFEWSNIMKQLSFGFGISDNACNYVIDKVNGSDIKSCCRYQNNFFLILERFPLIQRIFERIGRVILD